ncbi:hypothetical protein AGMMS49959_15280 [Planctomycetales bacterium]|nr:hypothetical protein AGMMS49959_15280 [Planctomycetales bacterium]
MNDEVSISESSAKFYLREFADDRKSLDYVNEISNRILKICNRRVRDKLLLGQELQKLREFFREKLQIGEFDYGTDFFGYARFKFGIADKTAYALMATARAWDGFNFDRLPNVCAYTVLCELDYTDCAALRQHIYGLLCGGAVITTPMARKAIKMFRKMVPLHKITVDSMRELFEHQQPAPKIAVSRETAVEEAVAENAESATKSEADMFVAKVSDEAAVESDCRFYFRKFKMDAVEIRVIYNSQRVELQDVIGALEEMKLYVSNPANSC